MKRKSLRAEARETLAYIFFFDVVFPPPPDGGVVVPLLVVLDEDEPLDMPVPEDEPLDMPVPEDELEPEAGAVVLLLPVAGALLVAAGGVEAGAVADWLDGCLAQAVNSTAAASALRATLIFIDGTPVE